MIVAKKSKKTKKSQGYRVYKMLSNSIKRTLDKSVPSLKSVEKWPGLGIGTTYMNSLNDPAYFDSFRSEFLWETEGRNAIFLKQDDIETIERGKCNVKFMPDNFLPFKSFMLCLPSEYEVLGTIISGVLISSFDSCAQWDSDAKNFSQKVFSGLGEIPPTPSIQPDKNKGVSILYLEKGSPTATNFTLYGKDLELAINSTSFTEFDKILNVGAFAELGFTKAEREVQYIVFKLILSLAMYIKAQPESLTDGFPVKGGFSLSEPFSGPVSGKTMKVSTKHKNSPEEHHRGWFIRQLVAECYYRGEYKDLEPGSRMVFVDETTVNLKVASHNIQGEAA
jgi:hypothetical protein